MDYTCFFIIIDVVVRQCFAQSIAVEVTDHEWQQAQLNLRKHRANDPKCLEFGWVFIPLAVETYGNWGSEAQTTFSYLASNLAIITSSYKGKVLTELYSRLNFTLVRSVARALLARCAHSLGLMDIL